jgi:hypothetical protein
MHSAAPAAVSLKFVYGAGFISDQAPSAGPSRAGSLMRSELCSVKMCEKTV